MFCGKRNCPDDYPDGPEEISEKGSKNQPQTSDQARLAEALHKPPQPLEDSEPSPVSIALHPVGQQAPERNRKKLKDLLAERLISAPQLIIDCDFEQQQKEKDLKSIVVQLSDCINLNKRATHPFKLHLTGVHKKLQSMLEKQ